MSKELREKAERLVYAHEQMESLFPILAGKGDAMTDSLAVCRAYLAEHPLDDEEPVTEKWLRSVGFVVEEPDHANGMRIRFKEGFISPVAANKFWDGIEIYNESDANDDQDGVLAVFKNDLIRRADVRRLCAALGIELKE